MSTTLAARWPGSSNPGHNFLGRVISVNHRYDTSPTPWSWLTDFFIDSKYKIAAGCQVSADATTALPSKRAEAKPVLLTQIAEYLSLPDDWDGYGGKAANLATVMDTFEFIKRYPSTFPTPKSMIGGSGVIGLYWEGNDCYVSIEFDGSGYYCYIADTKQAEDGEDAVPVDSPLPQCLAEVIMATADSF